ncbi:hypothetical protein AA980_22630 [Neobacillus vireti]|nr:hypothetical protein AA980_22630 [Neobacillus vireti]
MTLTDFHHNAAFLSVLFFKNKAVLKNIVNFEHNVDLRYRRETPAGAAGQVRPHRRAIRRGGSPPAPRKAKPPGTEINIPFNTAKNKKTDNFLSLMVKSIKL